MRGKRVFRRTSGNSRFRKRRGVWLPTLGTTWSDDTGPVFHDSAFTLDGLTVPDSRTNEVGSGEVIAVVPDFSFMGSEGQTDPGRSASLHDRTQGNEWFLDSIVGNCFVRCSDGDDTNAWNFIQCTAGFFVARSEDGNDASPDLFGEEYDPQNLDNIQNPWIWRRTWMLANPSGTGILRDDFPISNTNYSESAGPVIRTKTKRRIRREHRLWFSIMARGWDGNDIEKVTTTGTQPSYQALLDIRIFGQMRSNPKGASSF